MSGPLTLVVGAPSFQVPLQESVMTVAARTIEDRLRAVEDGLEIYNLMASHPPTAGTGADYTPCCKRRCPTAFLGHDFRCGLYY